MNYESLPLWLAIPAAILLVIGSTLPLIGAIGLVRLKSFYERIHAPTLGTSLGTFAVLVASMLLGSWSEDRMMVHEIVIGVFILLTTPVTMMFLGRAALHRGRAEGEDVPSALALRPAPRPAPTTTPKAEEEEGTA